MSLRGAIGGGREHNTKLSRYRRPPAMGEIFFFGLVYRESVVDELKSYAIVIERKWCSCCTVLNLQAAFSKASRSTDAVENQRPNQIRQEMPRCQDFVKKILDRRSLQIAVDTILSTFPTCRSADLLESKSTIYIRTEDGVLRSTLTHDAIIQI